MVAYYKALDKYFSDHMPYTFFVRKEVDCMKQFDYFYTHYKYVSKNVDQIKWITKSISGRKLILSTSLPSLKIFQILEALKVFTKVSLNLTRIEFWSRCT